MSEKSLIIASVFFAVLWTVQMMWWESPLGTVGYVTLAISGVVVGLLWYWLYGKWARAYFARRDAGK